MLVLSRKLGQRIMVGTDIVFTVVEIRGDKVRLGVDAPRGIAIHREEVLQRILAEQAAAPEPGQVFRGLDGDLDDGTPP